MPAHIVFLTLYLGLVSGRQPIELQADPTVASMRIFVDGAPAATLTSPPWKALVDFGRRIEPLEVVAVGYDSKGAEVGRASQAINLPRPVAEAEVVIQNDAQGKPATAQVRWRHLTAQEPRRMTLKLDDRLLALEHGTAKLPEVDLASPHVLSAELQFSDGFARQELVFGGTMPDTTGSELTATLVSQTGTPPASLDGCFSFGDQPVRAQAVEKGEALVILVRDPNPQEAVSALIPTTARRNPTDATIMRRTAMFDATTRLRLLWPVADHVATADQPSAVLFRFTGDFDQGAGGTLWHLVTSHESKGDFRKRQFADAVAVAGVQAMTGARRRAVVLVLGNAADGSRYDPATVRHYLASIGVPLFVWSFGQVSPELTAAWGEIVKVTNQQKLREATEAVKKNLDAQRIAWLDADPIHALRAKVREGCNLELVASSSKL
jgi:hypothetical protein